MNDRRRIAVLTTSRAEYGLLRELIRAVHDDPGLELVLLVSGAHLSPAHGHTVEAIARDGFPIAKRLPILLEGDSPLDAACSAGQLTIHMANALADLRPDLLVLLGDRYELLAAASAALALGVPMAHIHGGELSFGAIDDSVRHALTELASYHFVATRAAAQRVRQMGEPPSRIFRVGALGVDSIRTTPRLGRRALEEQLGISLRPPVAVVTLHPETRSERPSQELAASMVQGLESLDLTAVITHPGADPGRQGILDELAAYAARCPDRRCLVASLGQTRYYSLLALAEVMVGNSSSGLLEAPTFRLPVVNIGRRQDGRERARNVIDCAPTAEAVRRAVRRALSRRFRDSLRGLRNPFGDGHAVARIQRLLHRLPLGAEALHKQFHDLPGGGGQ